MLHRQPSTNAQLDCMALHNLLLQPTRYCNPADPAARLPWMLSRRTRGHAPGRQGVTTSACWSG